MLVLISFNHKDTNVEEEYCVKSPQHLQFKHD